MSSWYMTVQFPGGDYAIRAEDILAASTILHEHQAGIEYLIIGKYVNPGGGKFDPLANIHHPACYMRLCPPELAEWLDFGPMWRREPDPWRDGAVARRKVPGGWLLIDGAGDSASQSFIPVAHSAGIVVLEASNE